MKPAMSELVIEMIDVAARSMTAMRSRFAGVKWCGEGIEFTFDGVRHVGRLNGRNRDLMLGWGDEQDRSIAFRCWLDGCAEVAE